MFHDDITALKIRGTGIKSVVTTHQMAAIFEISDGHGNKESFLDPADARQWALGRRGPISITVY